MLDGERVDVILVTGVENHLPAPTNVTCLCHVWARVAPELYKGKELSPGIFVIFTGKISISVAAFQNNF